VCVAVYCSVLQYFAVCCGVLQCLMSCIPPRENLVMHMYAILVLKCNIGVLQCVAVCCSVLQCVAVCCSVMYRAYV